MLRSFFINLSKASWAQRIVTHWKIAWLVASRFVAGNTIQDAIAVVREFNNKGINVTLDHLGESTRTLDEAIKATEDILKLIEEINNAGVSANVSIKLTQIGLALDEVLCRQNLLNIINLASKYNNFIRIDMEDTPFTEKTIQLFQQLREEGYWNVGLVIQAYLFRSMNDVEELLANSAKIRLVKGAYDEPDELAFPKKADVDVNYDLLAQKMLDATSLIKSQIFNADGHIPPLAAFGTQDPKRIQYIKDHTAKLDLPKHLVEFQMLYGIRRDLQSQCHDDGYPIRIYVPYGTHWYPYFMRRLAERPANLWFFLSNFFRK